MAGLNQKDIDILGAYAGQGNRELYFNYLAQKEGNDGYGLLALGVVRNDNAPGSTANHFAQRQALRDGVTHGERDWQEFGVELVENDFALRLQYFDNQRPDLALNLPVLDVRDAHDLAFQRRQINPDAWTPRQLLQAAHRHGDIQEAEKVWSTMLDNTGWGSKRFLWTSDDVARAYNDQELNASSYYTDMGAARVAAASAAPNTTPDSIRLGDGKSYTFHSDSGTWYGPAPIESRIQTRVPISDPDRLEALNDAREVRLHRQQLRTEFHPDDPNQHRPIIESPKLITDAGPMMDPRDPSHPRHALHQQCVAGVQLLDARFNKPWDAHSACMAASLTHLAASHNLERVDHVVLSQKGTKVAAGEIVFVVEGELNDPAHRRAHMPTAQAVTTPPEQSFQQLAELDQVRGQSQAQEQVRTQEHEARAAMTMRG